MGFRIIDDLTSDVMFEADGKSLRELFESAAEALMSIICDIGSVEPKKSLDVSIRGSGREELMMSWLQELIALVDTEGMFFSKFELQEIDEKHIRARVSGEKATPAKGGTVVKAVTYHKFRLARSNSGYIMTATLDI